MSNDLMNPRFKLIADYPGNVWAIGTISTEIATASYFRKYPANFKELFWWEDRKPEDMPGYVRCVKVISIRERTFQVGEIFKVTRWFDSVRGFFDTDGTGVRFYLWENSFIPATESDYNAWLNQGTNLERSVANESQSGNKS